MLLVHQELVVTIVTEKCRNGYFFSMLTLLTAARNSKFFFQDPIN